MIQQVISRPRAGVFVYGDIGRSPRMQNHAQQLSKTHQVYFMGYLETTPRSQIVQNIHIHLVDLEISGLGKLKSINYWLYVAVRLILQTIQILYLLGWKYRNLEFVLVQNPPSIPNLFAIWLVSFVSFYKIYIDFHNYGYTILSLNVKNKLLNIVAKQYEKFFGKRNTRAFCVSDAMKADLKQNWGIQATTLYDRPRQNFVHKTSQSIFWKKYRLTPPEANEMLIVSSTSWTKDEDFSILLNALQQYNKSQAKKKIRAFITGKGPEKEYYLNKINGLKNYWTKVSVETVWLDADDYPILLSLCDLGVCLHYSSSGLDLPMKVVDMFGAGIPVLAIEYKCIGQLVQNEINGYTFKNSEQLSRILIDLSENKQKLAKLKQGAEKQKEMTWDIQWSNKFKLQ